MRPEDSADFNAFLLEFQKETDRGAALVGAAVIDHRLRETLRAFMIADKMADELLEAGTAPLGTFAARIKTTYMLGLIDEPEFRECELVRKVRNEFAHRAHGITFADDKVASFCERLQSHFPFDNPTPRKRFINAVILVALSLTYRAEWVAKERRVTRSWP